MTWTKDNLLAQIRLVALDEGTARVSLLIHTRGTDSEVTLRQGEILSLVLSDEDLREMLGEGKNE